MERPTAPKTSKAAERVNAAIRFIVDSPCEMVFTGLYLWDVPGVYACLSHRRPMIPFKEWIVKSAAKNGPAHREKFRRHAQGSVLFLERFQEGSPRINLCKTMKIKFYPSF